jgi:small-conductance mechanosensitive channel
MPSTDDRALIAALEAQVKQLQEELADQAAQAGAAIAESQERSQQLAHELSQAQATIAERRHWLRKRLIEVSRRPGAGWLRTAIDVLRPLYRAVKRNGRASSS